MAIQGGTVETKEIGIPIANDGTFTNTEIVNDTIQLKKQSNGLLYETGSWTSRTIDIGDNFANFEKLLTTNIGQGKSSIVVRTSTSLDGIEFEAYRDVGEEGQIRSTKNRYIRVRINFTAGKGETKVEISNIKLIESNEFIEEVDGVIQFKKNLKFDMTIDNSWSEDGTLNRRLVRREDWLKIDSLNVADKEVI